MKADYLNGTEYTLEQPEEMYHFNSDTELLGRFMRLRRSDRVLDIGCNTGALLLYAAHQKAQDLTGIDLFDSVLRQAVKNLRSAGIEAKLEKCRVQDYAAEPFDVIVCNPPYFRTKDERLKNSSEIIRAARHEEYLKPEELFSAAGRLLKRNGRLYLVHRASRLNELILKAGNHGLQAVRMRIAYGSKTGHARSVLLEMRFAANRELLIEKPVFLDERDTFADEGEEKA